MSNNDPWSAPTEPHVPPHSDATRWAAHSEPTEPHSPDSTLYPSQPPLAPTQRPTNQSADQQIPYLPYQPVEQTQRSSGTQTGWGAPPSLKQPKKRRWWLFLALAAAALIMIVLIFTSLQQVHGPLNPPPAAADNNPRMFHVGDHALLKLKLHAGDVSVQTADSDTLTVEPRKHGTLNAPDYTSVHILYDQITNSQGHQELTVHTDPWLREIDFAITIPQTTSLQLALDSGSIDVHGGQGITASTESGTLDLEDINGPVDVHTTNGDITAKNIHGAVKLDGQNGSLHLQKIQGAVKATTTSGDVIAREMAMSGQSLLQTQNGSIRFDGSIDPKGAYTLTTTNGDVDLTLPSTSSFSLDATTTNGSIQNAFGSTNVGTSPQALLKLHTQNGSLHLVSQP